VVVSGLVGDEQELIITQRNIARIFFIIVILIGGQNSLVAELRGILVGN
jgi:hypothetical protein